jgi:hypothetical protein
MSRARPSARKNGFFRIPKGGSPCEIVAEVGTGDFLRLRDIDKLWQGDGFDAPVMGIVLFGQELLLRVRQIWRT